MLKKLIPAIATAFVLLGLGPVATAQGSATSDRLSVEDVFKLPTMAALTISPNGRYLAVTMPNRGRMNLSVVDLETRMATGLTGYEEFDVTGIVWVSNDRLLYSLGQFNSPTAGNFDGGGLFVISRDGKETKRLSPTVREMRARGDLVARQLRFFRRIPGNSEEIIASGNMTAADSTDLYRLNLNTGKHTLMTSGRPADYGGSWILDSKLVPRVMHAWIRDTQTFVVYYRSAENSPWVELSRYSRDKGDILIPLAFEKDDKTMQVAHNGGRDTMAVYRYDPETKKLGEMIASHPRYDMGAQADGGGASGVMTDPDTEKLLGYVVDGMKPERVWVDEKYSATQKALDAALPDAINSFRRLPGGSKRMLVTSYSDTKTQRWYLYDEEARTLERIGVSRPWQDGKRVPQVPFVFKTRDGLEIPGYYFLPKGHKPGTKLPTVVHIHGGPFARADFWGGGFGVNEGQLFASHGYAVIVPNFRITPGFGKKVYQAGFGSVGRQMSDDHEDALKWGIEQGFVDPERVCISGASYGGYAALQALVRNTNDMWKCGVAGLAVTDYEYQLTSRDGDTAPSESGVAYWKSVLGTNDLGSKLIRDISPVFNADKIKKPVIFYSGRDDIRVPLPQINRMVKELERAGNPPKAHIVKDKEGHGFGKLENRVDTWMQILAFLDENIGKKK